MKEELQKKLLEYLQGIERLATDGEAFLGEQIPLVAQEIISWGIWENVFDILFSLAVIVFCALGVKALSALNEATQREPELILTTIWGVLSVVLGVVAVIVIYNSGLELAKVLSAPRLYLLEEVQELIK